MDIRLLLDFLEEAGRLKCTVRHSYTSTGRQESVAEHTCRLCMFIWLVRREFEELDMERVMELGLFHDLGEAVTGDVPCFEKRESDCLLEQEAVKRLISMLPPAEEQELLGIFREIEENQTGEARLLHALDKLEALISHNEAPIDTWLANEYELQLTYGQEEARAFAYTRKLRKAVEQDSIDKIQKEGPECGYGEKVNYYVSRDLKKLSLARVVSMLRQSYWAKNRPKELIKKAIEGSVCYGVYDKRDYMVGFARIITDYATTFYLMDVIIDEKLRGQGLGTMLMEAIMADVGHLHGVLHTEDAHGFYEKYGFQSQREKPEEVMEKPRP